MEWKTSTNPVDYEEAVSAMEARVRAIGAGEAGELIWLLEHPALYTAGTSARDSDLIDTLGFPVYKTGRGGQYTYHGPGQRVIYVMMDLRKRGQDVRRFVCQLEKWIIATLAGFGIKGELREGRVGVWVNTSGGAEGDDLAQRGGAKRGRTMLAPYKQEQKIAALGIRLKSWVSYHGIAINVNPDLSHFQGIVPCGLRDYGVTSLAALGINATMADVDEQLKRTFDETLGTGH